MIGDRFKTLTFARKVAAPVTTLYAVWTSPAARAVWASPGAGVTVEFLEADSQVGGREVSLCKVAGEPDLRVEVGWLDLVPDQRSVGYEVVSSEGIRKSAALVTTEFAEEDTGSQIRLTVQLASLAEDMAEGYRQGFSIGVANLAAAAERTMLLQRLIKAPVAAVWRAWTTPEALSQWWGPDGYTCQTSKIKLGAGGDWVFDMIAPDGTVFPNHHHYGRVVAESSIDYTLHAGENGAKHADAWVTFVAEGDATRVTLGMVMASSDDYRNAVGFGAVTLGLQTLGKLARFVGPG